ncbi:spermidine synthase [Catellatospora coxensis]
MIRGSDRALIVRVDTGTAELIPDPDLPDAWLLRLNGTAQSHVNLNDPTLIAFDYIRRFADVIDAVAPPGPLDVLHLGGGALTLPRCLSAMRPGSGQRVVELDRALADLVTTRLPLDDDDIELIIADARAALEQAEPASADVIVADIFTGNEVPRTSAPSSSPKRPTASCAPAAGTSPTSWTWPPHHRPPPGRHPPRGLPPGGRRSRRRPPARPRHRQPPHGRGRQPGRHPQPHPPHSRRPHPSPRRTRPETRRLHPHRPAQTRRMTPGPRSAEHYALAHQVRHAIPRSPCAWG